MPFFQSLFSKSPITTEKTPSSESEEVIRTMLANAQAFLAADNPERAFETYQRIVEIAPDPVAQYNLASLYAQGKGTVQDFLQAARWFHQAEKNGDAKAGQLCTKCMLEYLRSAEPSPQQIYQAAARFASAVYPEQSEQETTGEKLYQLAMFYKQKAEIAPMLAALRAAAQFGDNATAQNQLGLWYNSGIYLEKDDVAAMYWFGRAAENGNKAAEIDRDGILNAFYRNFTTDDFASMVKQLLGSCETGTSNIPRDLSSKIKWEKRFEKFMHENQNYSDHTDCTPTVERYIDIVVERIQNLPNSKGAITFQIPDTNNRAVVRLFPLGKETENDWVYEVGACREGTDKLCDRRLFARW